MTGYVALLRGVNLAGHNKLAMADLKELAAGLGLTEPRTLLQSGNLVFGAEGRTPAELERALEAETKKRLGLATDYFVRSAAEWKAIVTANPFRKEAARDPGHLLVSFLKDAPKPASVRALQAAITGREVLHVRGREAYIVYPDGVGKSRLTSALADRKLETRGTGRNWNTVLRIAALLGV
jgi:uncharacterized protein (DUF1697 family)